MEISVKKLKNQNFALEVEPVTIELTPEVVKSLHEVINLYLKKGQSQSEDLEKKLSIFRALADKLVRADDRVLQHFLSKLTPGQLVTLVRLSTDQKLYQKVLKNLSRTNARQFEEDYREMDKITQHQAVVYMEQIIPQLKAAIAEQKKIEAEGV
ncbi:FliG C-terminal domain-containing protein [Galenea microaerophila]